MERAEFSSKRDKTSRRRFDGLAEQKLTSIQSGAADKQVESDRYADTRCASEIERPAKAVDGVGRTDESFARGEFSPLQMHAE